MQTRTLIDTTEDGLDDSGRYGQDTLLVEEAFAKGSKYYVLTLDGSEFGGTRADWQKLADANLPALFKAMGVVYPPAPLKTQAELFAEITGRAA